MNYLFDMISYLKLEFSIGTDIDYAIDEALRVSKLLNVIIQFEFNSCTMYVDHTKSKDHYLERFRSFFIK